MGFSYNPFHYFVLPRNFIGSFLKSQFAKLPYPDHDFSNQTIIITGANVGLGLEAARHIVRLNAARVIIACRSLDKGEAAKSDIESTTGRTGVVEVWQVDLSSYESVKAFCKKVEGLDRLDAIVENAGVATPKFELMEGTESTITVNVISTFLMALMVLPTLRASASKYNVTPHLTIVASDAHEQAKFREARAPNTFEALAMHQNQSDRYNASKLIEILVVRQLAPQLSTSTKGFVILNTLTPGFCYSDLMRHAVFPLNVLGWIGKRLIGRTTEVGSRTLVEAAKAGPETHGIYMTDCKVGEVSEWVRSEEGVKVQEKIYSELIAVLESIEPGVSGNI